MVPSTDEELVAYADERLSPVRCAEIELALRDDKSLRERLISLLAQRDQGVFSVGEIWRCKQLSCPSRSVWSAYLDQRLGDGLSQYLRFHIDVIGCRVCIANLEDLQRHGNPAESERRTRKIFQSSAGRLKDDAPEEPGRIS